MCRFGWLIHRTRERERDTHSLIEERKCWEREQRHESGRVRRVESWEATEEKKREGGREEEKEGGRRRRREGAKLESGRRLLLWPDVKLQLSSTVFLLDFNLLFSTSALDIWGGKMYERHKRRYSLCAKGERAVDVVLIKVGYLSALSNKVT